MLSSGPSDPAARTQAPGCPPRLRHSRRTLRSPSTGCNFTERNTWDRIRCDQPRAVHFLRLDRHVVKTPAHQRRPGVLISHARCVARGAHVTCGVINGFYQRRRWSQRYDRRPLHFSSIDRQWSRRSEPGRSDRTNRSRARRERHQRAGAERLAVLTMARAFLRVDFPSTVVPRRRATSHAPCSAAGEMQRGTGRNDTGPAPPDP
jgi:hypothetical protein